MITPEMQELNPQLSVSREIHSDDFIYHFLSTNCDTKTNPSKYYFEDGRRSAEKLRYLISDHTNLDLGRGFSLLEFASGYGCVTRHLRQVLPACAITACDIHEQAVAFIQHDLRIPAVLSTSRPAHFDLHGVFDLVFALSFFSHMPSSTWGEWLEALFRHLRSGGYLIFTTHGQVTRDKIYPDLTMPENGFWFTPTSEQKDLDLSEYGTTITLPDYVTSQVYKRLRAPLPLFSQGFWWGHQDVYVVAKLTDPMD
jgi:SAM-dependent methyltransferase